LKPKRSERPLEPFFCEFTTREASLMSSISLQEFDRHGLFSPIWMRTSWSGMLPSCLHNFLAFCSFHTSDLVRQLLWTFQCLGIKDRRPRGAEDSQISQFQGVYLKGCLDLSLFSSTSLGDGLPSRAFRMACRMAL